LIATDLSVRLGLIERGVLDRVRALIAAAGLPTLAPRIGAAHALELMQMDKKVQDGTIRLVVLDSLGTAVVSGSYSTAALDACLNEHFG
jgi:3-dehydroquinate synthase